MKGGRRWDLLLVVIPIISHESPSPCCFLAVAWHDRGEVLRYFRCRVGPQPLVEGAVKCLEEQKERDQKEKQATGGQRTFHLFQRRHFTYSSR